MSREVEKLLTAFRVLGIHAGTQRIFASATLLGLAPCCDLNLILDSQRANLPTTGNYLLRELKMNTSRVATVYDLLLTKSFYCVRNFGSAPASQAAFRTCHFSLPVCLTCENFHVARSLSTLELLGGL